MADTFAGFTAQNIGADYGFSPDIAQALIHYTNTGQLSPQEQQLLGALPDAKLKSIQATISNPDTGFQHLAEHPAGSHYHGDINVLDTVANVATGGVYGAAKAGYEGATGQTDLLGAARGGLNQLGPWGSSTYNIPGYGPSIAEAGNFAGAGAGVGGGGGFGGGGFGTASDAAPYYAGLGTGAEQVGASAGGGALGALTGAGVGYQASQMLGGQSPLSMPSTGAPAAGFAGGGGLNAQQLAALSAMNSQAHRGLAPAFEARMKGQSSGAGIAGDAFNQFGQP